MKTLTIKLTEAEAKALLSVAGEGYEGLANDEEAAAAYLDGQPGVDAADRAMQKLRQAIYGKAVAA